MHYVFYFGIFAAWWINEMQTPVIPFPKLLNNGKTYGSAGTIAGTNAKNSHSSGKTYGSAGTIA